MKRLFTIAIATICLLPLLHAQESTFNLDDKVVNIGIGLGSTYGFGLYNSTVIPPLSISLEKGILDEILEKGVIGV